MQAKDTIQGFTVLNAEEVPEVKGNVYELEHDKTGARLVYVKNEDPNKVFSIGFRTPSKDDTGIFHILEHSVLGGSRKYPLKEPFVDLLKGSLNTFLNAMTYNEKTLYPVASMNDQDFANLMDTYLDAVFFPSVREKKEIFLQEGWHYEFNEDDELVYGGIVFNEMKGAMSDSRTRFTDAFEAALYPNSPYATNAGGDPLSIPDLTWEKLVDGHATYYHPSNSFIYLYGDLNIEDRLKHVSEYLDEFNALDLSDKLVDLNGESPLAEAVVEFPISENEDQANQAYLGYGVKFDDGEKKELRVAFTILKELLLDGESAPLRNTLLKEGLGKNVFGNFDTGSPKPAFTIAVSQSEAEKKERFEEVVHETLTKLAENGLDKKVVEAAVASVEFQLREADFGGLPEGLFYGLSATEAYVAGNEIVDALKYEEALSMIKLELDNGYFEKLIQSYILDNDQKSIVVAKPSTQIGRKEYEDEQLRLKKANEELTEEVRLRLKQEETRLKEYQNSEDTPESKAKLPRLDLEDIDKEPVKLPTKQENIEDVPLLVHPQKTNKLAYYSFYFDAGEVAKEELPYYRLFAELIGKLGTSQFSADQLAQEIAIEVGKIDFSNSIYAENIEDAAHKVRVSVRTTEDRLQKSIDLIHHIFTGTVFENKDKVKEVIGKVLSGSRSYMENSGHAVGLTRVASYHTAAGAKNEPLSGITFHHFITDLENTFEDQFDQFITKIRNIAEVIYKKAGLIVSFTGEESGLKKFREAFKKLELSTGKVSAQKESFEPRIVKEAFSNSSQIVYVSQGTNVNSIGKKITGQLLVAQNMLNLDYLWNKLRAIGGAYGGGLQLQLNGNLGFYSYRDPNVARTIDTYNKTAEFLETVSLDEDDLQRLIIGTIGSLDQPLTPRMVGDQADAYYFQKISEGDRKQIRQEVLSTSVADIKATSELFKELDKKQSVVVIGSERLIEEERDAFDTVQSLFK